MQVHFDGHLWLLEAAQRLVLVEVDHEAGAAYGQPQYIDIHVLLAGVPGVKVGPPGAAAPEARAKQVSLVEVSESTVTLLKLLFTAAVRAADRSGGVRGASVVMTAIMVAMFGMIMPAPLAMAPTVNVAPG